MGVFRVVVTVIVVVMVVIVGMVMTMMMMMMMMVMVPLCLQSAQARAERIAQAAIRHVRARRAGALAFDMVMVAFLHGAHLGFEAQDGGAIFAHHAGRRGDVAERR